MSVRTLGVTETTFEVENGEWPIRKTTVYDNQAEIRRSLNFTPTQHGTNLLKLRGLPDTINASSLRAEVTNCRLLEVFHDHKYEEGKPDDKIRERLEEIETERELLLKQQTRLNIKKEKLTTHKNAVHNSLDANVIDKQQEVLDPSIYKSLDNALNFYNKMFAGHQKEWDDLQAQFASLSFEETKLREQQANNTRGKWVHIASVLIEVDERLLNLKKHNTVDIDLIYLANGASWYASYDIRVEKGETEEVPDKAVLSYYAQVTNRTTENWVEVEMALSTAKPSVGGAPPPLPRRQVDFRRAMVGHGGWHSNANEQRRLSLSMPAQMMMNKADFGGMLDNAVIDDGIAADAFMAAPPTTATVSSGDAGSTLFKIKRLANIDSDGSPRKQTIGIIPLQADFTHAASPKVSKDVYIKCLTKNASEFPFLKGTLRVFVDGSFVSNSSMQLVRPGEAFAVFLGIDDSVRISYSPPKEKKKTVGGGLTTKKKWHKTVGREITIINNSGKLINCCIYEQLPLAKDGKIKVDLKKPDIKKTTKTLKYKVNTFNNLETRTQVPADGKFKMEFEYTMEWPEGEKLKFSYKHPTKN